MSNSISQQQRYAKNVPESSGGHYVSASTEYSDHDLKSDYGVIDRPRLSRQQTGRRFVQPSAPSPMETGSDDRVINDETSDQYLLERLAATRALAILPKKLLVRAMMSTPDGRAVMPHKMDVQLPYTELLTLASPSSGNIIAGKMFNCLSAYDPNYTDVGHQPLGYDQWASLYSQYFVRSVSWRAEFSQSTSSATVLAICNAIRGLTLTGSQADTYIEQPGSKNGIVRHATSGGPMILEGVIKTSDWFPGATLASLDDIRSDTGSSPAEAIGFHLGIGTFVSHTAVNVYVKLHLKYNITFLKPVQLQGS